MTPEHIRQAAEKITNKAVGKYPDHHNKPTWDEIRNTCTNGIVDLTTTALTHGWYKPEVVPEGYTALICICKNEVGNPYYEDAEWAGLFFEPFTNRKLTNVLYWRYDNAADILELLKDKGV